MIRDSSSIYGEMFKALSDVARRHGLNLILYDTNNDPGIEKRCIQNLIDTMAMGIIVVPVSENINGIRRMTKNTVPVVYLGGNVRPDDVNYVCCDSTVGTELALKHLVDQGHRKIVMLCDSKTSNSHSRKNAVYQQTMRERGKKELILHSEVREQDLAKAGYALGRYLVAEGTEFTALFAVKDTLAIGAMGALREAGIKIPEQVSVVGYDGIDASELSLVELTTVAQLRMEMAENVIVILLRHAQKASTPPEHYLAKPKLKIRHSTSAR